MGEEKIPIEAFHGLLRDLLIWNLVVPGEPGDDEADSWRLVPDAQQRLTELAAANGPWPAEKTVYVDRRCTDCGFRQLTWLRDGDYLCGRCWQARRASDQNADASVGAIPEHRPWWVARRRNSVA
jgi:hypothetical protein